MDLTERKVSSQTIFEGQIVKLTVDQARLPDGNLASREVVYHPGGVAVLALDEGNNVFLVRQYRYPIQQLLVELPAGKLDHGAEEDILLGAKRELSEECGLSADNYIDLGVVYPTVGYDSEKIYLWAATGLHKGGQHLDAGEFLDVVRMPFEEALQKVLHGEIKDSKTQIGLMKYALLRDKA